MWLGGMPGVGKTTAARAIARRCDLHLYSLDSHTYAHARRMNVRALGMTADELWVDRSPEQMVTDFESEARRRFPLVLDDLAALPRDAPVIAEGPQLLPDLVGPLRPSAVYVVAAPALQRRLLAARGSLTYARTRDPERAFANRARRDELLAERLRQAAGALGLPLVEVDDVRDVEAVVERAFEPALREWIERGERGDVAARRRDDNDRRLSQWRAYAESEPAAANDAVDLACECDRPACRETVPTSLREAETRRASGRPLVSGAHARG